MEGRQSGDPLPAHPLVPTAWSISMASRYNSDGWNLTGLLIALTLTLSAMVAWVTHVVWIVKALASDAGATAGQIVLGLLGAVIPPVGVIHGYIIWFS